MILFFSNKNDCLFFPEEEGKENRKKNEKMMHFEIITGQVKISDLETDARRIIEGTPGRWNIQLTHGENNQLKQIFVYHHKYTGDREEFPLSHPLVIDSGRLGVFDAIDFYPSSSVWLAAATLSPSLNVMPRGCSLVCPNGLYAVFATVDSHGFISSLRIAFEE